jgi:SAM-dependent methyltransferase
MAVVEIKSEEPGNPYPIVERIEVRPWWVGGKAGQDFAIGSGSNFGENSNILVEVIYSINDVQFFYTRNFLHYEKHTFPISYQKESLDKFKSGEREAVGFGDMLPETSIILRRENHTYEDRGEQKTYSQYFLEVSADIGAGVCRESPGRRKLNIELDLDDPQAGVDFMQQLVCEIVELHENKHPNPAAVAPGSSDWSFARLVNQKAYDEISVDYSEEYFSKPLLTESFDAWLADIPAGGNILDLGCGHGKPVIARLVEMGFRLTGADLSPKMLERARQNFPDVPFVNCLASELTFDSEFDAACSLSSLLYLDPVDLSHGLYRLHQALKPHGLLFLYAMELHPNWRGHPYHVDIDHWMWGWTYGMDEAIQALEEHGYYKVLKALDVTSEQAIQGRIERWYKAARDRYEEQSREPHPFYEYPEPDKSNPPALGYEYVVIAQVQK